MVKNIINIHIKKVLSWFLLIQIIFLTGCNKNISSHPKRLNDGNIVWTVSEKPDTLDPGLCGYMDGTDIINNMFEGLFRVIEKDVITSNIVKSYVVSEDMKTYVFEFYDDIFWSDGERVFPKDFETSWKRVLRSNFVSPRKELFLPIKNAKKIILDNIDPESLGVRAVQDNKLIVTLEYPISYLFHLLSLTPFMPVRDDVIDDDGLWAKDPQKFISNGPFYLSRYSDNSLVLKKNLFYRKNKNANVNSVLINFINDSNAAFMSYKSSNTDIIDSLPLNESKKLNFSKEFVSIPYYGLYFYSFNMNLDCFKDNKVRQAFSKAIDREKLIKMIRKTDELPANEYLYPDFMKKIDDNFEVKNYYDLSEAKKLLARAGYNKENPFPSVELSYNSESDNKIIAEAIQEMLKNNLQIDVTLSGQEWSNFNNKREHLEYNGLAKNSHMMEYFDPASFLELFKSGGISYCGYNNLIYNSVFDEILQLPSGIKRDKKILEAVKILDNDMPIIPLFYYSSTSLIKPYIKNYYINSIGYKYLGLINIA